MTRTSRPKFQARCECLENRQLLSGTYVINAYSGKVIEDPGFSTANGLDVQQHQLTGGGNQQCKDDASEAFAIADRSKNEICDRHERNRRHFP